MIGIFVRHKVEDAAKWKKAFHGFIDFRKAGGEKSYAIGNIHGEPNNLCLYFEWDSIENAEKFFASEELKAAMKDGGVLEEPEVYIVDEQEKGET